MSTCWKCTHLIPVSTEANAMFGMMYDFKCEQGHKLEAEDCGDFNSEAGTDRGVRDE